MPDAVTRALRLLGPLEGRIMREVWRGRRLPQPFTVREMRERMPELAHTTVMTTLNRLADKGVLDERTAAGVRGHVYQARQSAEAFLDASGRREVQQVIRRFGDTALAAFASHLDSLTPEQRERLRRTGGR